MIPKFLIIFEEDVASIFHELKRDKSIFLYVKHHISKIIFYTAMVPDVRTNRKC